MGEGIALQVTQLHLKNFRCFSGYTLDIAAPHVFIEGINGAGKTTLLEALHYACYLRSFRTHIPKELISFGKSDFFIKLSLSDQANNMDHTIQVGFSPTKRLVKVDQKTIESYKDLLSHYRVISVTEDDLLLVQSAPHVRRLALDQFMVLLDPGSGQQLKIYRHIVDQRNALLQQNPVNTDIYNLLTKQLWDNAKAISYRRIALLKELESSINSLGATFIPCFDQIQLIYVPKRELGESIEQFRETAGSRLYQQELRFTRSLFGTHLDDFSIQFQGNYSRLYASRGQQKMIVILFKMAQLKLLAAMGAPAICLLDDFMTDFDPGRASSLIEGLVTMGSQLIFTSPVQGGAIGAQLENLGAQRSKLTI